MDFNSISIRIKDYFSVPRVVKTINVILILLLVWVLGMGIARVIEHTILVTPFQPPEFIPGKKQTADIPLPKSEFQPIIRFNIFDAEIERPKEAPATITPTKAPGVNLRQILSNLVLIGTVQRSEGTSLCVIKDKRKKTEELFGIGDQIFETGAIVRRIIMTPGQQQVQVSYNDEVGILTLETIEETGQKKTAATPARKIPPPTKSTASNQPIINDYTTDGTNFYISSEEVESELDNFAKLLNQARMVPYFRKGQHQGYQVKAIDKGSLYEKLGLKNRDIIEEINGEPLNSMEKVMGFFSRLRNESEWTLKVKRNGVSKSLKYYIN